MYATTVRTASVSAVLTLMMALPTARPAAAAGVADAELADMVAKLLPSCVNITTTRYKEVQVAPGKSVMAQDAQADKKLYFGSGFIQYQ